PRLTVTPEAQSTPALRASDPRMAFTPALKGGALAKIRGRAGEVGHSKIDMVYHPLCIPGHSGDLLHATSLLLDYA
ncbi:hypothetical protein, partial [Streptomyces sp. NPDC002573]|uniref:hypothetical protein n=1 Tax=Streptomyces sp. NPDC002573 TaxID=3364651 RepID=UPI0036947EA2